MAANLKGGGYQDEESGKKGEVSDGNTGSWERT
jgi:hypothetical protein